MLESLQPQRVFHFFEDLCAIPHGSGNTDAISDYCVNFAAAHGLSCEKDASNNVLIRKPASPGYESHPTVILQGHLDMVCEKAPDCPIDFTKDGLSLQVDGDLLSADGTTLGADDGIAVAMILAVLEDGSLPHPPLEALFTTDEETGMYGAESFDVSRLQGHTLINLDSGEEGVLTVGCAGGAKVDVTLPVAFTENALPCWRVAISGLLGGHSGIDINKGRINADALLGRFLGKLPGNWRLVSIEGGFKDNVIPNAAACVIATETDISAAAETFMAAQKTESDPGLTVCVTPFGSPRAMDKASTARVVDFINAVPVGVAAMSEAIEGLVQSSQNLGVLKTDTNAVVAVLSVRSSVAAEKAALLATLSATAEKAGATVSVHGHYPAWEYRRESRLRDAMTAVYRRLYDRDPAVEMVHAGLECGLFGSKIPQFDAVSMGPNMWDIHTVGERLSISSTARTYRYLLQVLENL